MASFRSARDYQKFATTYFPSGRAEPLLDPAEIGAVPDDLTLPDCHIPQDPLPADMTAALWEYEAPNRLRKKVEIAAKILGTLRAA